MRAPVQISTIGSTPEPIIQSINSAGIDITSSEDVLVHAGEIYNIPTNVIIKRMPRTRCAMITDLPGYSRMLVHGCVYDSNYRHPITVRVQNIIGEDVMIPKGTVIARMIIMKQYNTETNIVMLER